MWPHKNQYDENAKSFKKKECIPKYIICRIEEFPFDNGAYSEIKEIPKADEAIGRFPNSRYFVE